MIKIAQPSREYLNNVDSEDVFSFTSQLIQELTLNKKGEEVRVYVNTIEHSKDTHNNNPLMINVKISFQVFNEEGKQWRGVWTNYRAKSFSCQNKEIRLSEQ